MLEFSIATISTFVGLLNQITKYIAKTYAKRDISKYIPIFSLVYGLILGISGYFIPNVTMGNNIIEAIFIGISAGAASTGIHQIYKQHTKNDETDTEIWDTLNDTTETIASEDEGVPDMHIDNVDDDSE